MSTPTVMLNVTPYEVTLFFVFGPKLLATPKTENLFKGHH